MCVDGRNGFLSEQVETATELVIFCYSFWIWSRVRVDQERGINVHGVIRCERKFLDACLAKRKRHYHITILDMSVCWCRSLSSQPTGNIHKPGDRLLLLSELVTFPATEHRRPLASTKLYCLMTEAYSCEYLAQSRYMKVERPWVKPTGFHGPSWRVTSFHYPSTRPVLTGNGNRSLVNSGRQLG